VKPIPHATPIEVLQGTRLSFERSFGRSPLAGMVSLAMMVNSPSPP
jgi:hypothetical protein